MNIPRLLSICAAAMAVLFPPAATAGIDPTAPKPNIIYILADDLGYGDVRCLNPEGKIATPNLDRMAREGMIFTDAHSGSAVCTPTRYGIMTGRYAWRSKLQSGVLGGLSPRLIEPGRATVASMLKAHGYRTGIVGKWHLGMDWAVKEGTAVTELGIETRAQVSNVDYAQPIQNGPLSVGFDQYFGISASLDMIPYTFIQNDRVVALPTEDRDFPMYEGRAGAFCRKGPTAPGFHTSQVLPRFTSEVVGAIQQHAAEAKQGKPFFLYVPLASPHTPIAPTPEWLGKSGLTPYADFVMQTDATVGAVLDALAKAGISENTLLIFTSDNGCSPSADFPELLALGHNPGAKLRGHKADIFEGGHRVPFLVRWPARIKGGSQSAQVVCLTDLYATCAEIVGGSTPMNAAEDSVSMLPALTGTDKGPLREATVHHSINGSFAIRQGKWKLAFCPGSGGWSAPRPNRDDASSLPITQLFDLDSDLGETQNVAAQNPAVVAALTKLMEDYIQNGRSTPGAPQANAVSVDLWKAAKDAQRPIKAKKKGA